MRVVVRTEVPGHGTFLVSLALMIGLTGWMVLGSLHWLPFTPLHLWLFGLAALGVTAATLYRVRDQRLPLHWIIGSAIVLRLFCLFGDPLFEDDFYRYMWEGLLVATGGNPYLTAPIQFFDQSLSAAAEAVLSRVSYPEIASVYGPVLQWIFGAAALVAPLTVWPLQLVAAVADVVTLILLARLFGANQPGRNMILLYAWSPLLMKEFALTAHPDVLAMPLLVGALLVARRDSFLGAGAMIGIATGVKIFAILLLPFLLLVGGTSRWPSRLAGLASGFCVAIGLITFAWSATEIWFPDGLRSMGASWLFNAPLHIALVQVLPFSLVKTGLLVLFIVFAGWLFFKLAQPGKRPAGAFATRWSIALALLYFVFLLASPVLNPWYFVFVLAFAAMTPLRWPWVASVMLLLSYWSGYGTATAHDQLYQLPVPIIVIEFGVILVAAVADHIRPATRPISSD